MPAKSQTQQRLMGMVYAYKKGELDMDNVPVTLRKEIKKIAKTIKKKDAKKMAETKHKGLPEKVKEDDISFKDFLTLTEEELEERMHTRTARMLKAMGERDPERKYDKPKTKKRRDSDTDRMNRETPGSA